MLAVQLPLLRRRFHYDPIIDLRDPPARKALALMVPRAIGLGVTQITFVVNTTLATTLVVGVGDRLQLSRSPSSRSRWASSGFPHGRGAAALPVARHRRGRHGRLPRDSWSAPCGCCCG